MGLMTQQRRGEDGEVEVDGCEGRLRGALEVLVGFHSIGV